jgi:hypothetical protein
VDGKGGVVAAAVFGVEDEREVENIGLQPGELTVGLMSDRSFPPWNKSARVYG